MHTILSNILFYFIFVKRAFTLFCRQTNNRNVPTRNVNWNDRSSRRLYLCFYSAIFKLTSVKFQTFVYRYNSRTVIPSSTKFRQQFEINELFATPNFEAIGPVTLVLGPENRP